MIKAVHKGDLFDSGAQTLVNTVNTVGVMGKGIALEFKRRYPDMFADYQRRCAEGAVRLGEPYLWRGLLEPWIVNFPTKEHWRSASRIDDVERGLRFLADHLEQWGVASLAVPPLGAGSGGLDWLSIGPTLYRHLEALPIPVLLYVPFDVPDEQATIAFLAARERPMDGAEQAAHANGRLQPGWMVIAEIVRRINHIRYAWPVGRIRLQKIAYFATMAGVPSGFQYVEGSYGPFTPDLGPALGRLINNGVIVERPIGRCSQSGPALHSTTPTPDTKRQSSRTKRRSTGSWTYSSDSTVGARRSLPASTSPLALSPRRLVVLRVSERFWNEFNVGSNVAGHRSRSRRSSWRSAGWRRSAGLTSPGATTFHPTMKW
jgi:O-acetyl-ADP-ribose deacetylase (regulator of RNase III)